jgi:hypothetical protein
MYPKLVLSSRKLPTSLEATMSTQTTLHGLGALRLVLIAALVVCGSSQAHSGGHSGAVGHGFGFHGGFGWSGWPGYGLFLATLPLYYSTWWWNGVPYGNVRESL